MSDENKPDLALVPSRTEINKELMFEDFCKGHTKKEIAEIHMVSTRTVIRAAKEANWDVKKAEREAEEFELSVVSNQDVLVDESINSAARALWKMSQKLENDILLGKEPSINHKSLVDSIDKLTRLRMHVDSGGVAKTEVNVKKTTLDWNALIELSVKTKREQGDNFDEKTFLKGALDAEVVPGSEKTKPGKGKK